MQSSSKEVMEEGQQYGRMESFEKPVLNENGFPEKNVLVPICAKLPMYLDKVVSQLIEKLCNNLKHVK